MSEVRMLNSPNNIGDCVKHANVVFRTQKPYNNIRTDAKAREFVNSAETNLYWSKHLMRIWKNIIWIKSRKFGSTIAPFVWNHFRPTTNCCNTWKPLIQMLIRSMSKTTCTLVQRMLKNQKVRFNSALFLVKSKLSTRCVFTIFFHQIFFGDFSVLTYFFRDRCKFQRSGMSGTMSNSKWKRIWR